jgi:glycerol kinase
VGFWKNTKEITAFWQRDKTFVRRMKKAEAQSLYRGWLCAVGRTLSHGRKVIE